MKHRPCTTADKSPGFCGPLSSCPYINNLIKSSTPQNIEFASQSICGYDIDNSKLYCCNETRVAPNTTVNKPANIHIDAITQNVEAKKKVELVRPALVPTTTTTSPLSRVGDPVSPPSQPLRCRTPNGDQAECIPIYNCTMMVLFLKNNASTSESQKRFIRESKCSFEGDDISVCCGSDVDFRYSVDGSQTSLDDYYQNGLIPTDCGVDIPESVELSQQAPRLESRNMNSNSNMNFTIPNRIFGGDDSDINEFPWIALLQYMNLESNERSFQCAGSLISSRYVLTAAHCLIGSVSSKIIGVRLGEWNYSSEGASCFMTTKGRRCSKAAVDVAVASLLPHPAYNPRNNNKYDDIGLIRLDKDIEFSSHISPICLPPANSYLQPGERLTIAGWGLKGFNKLSVIKQKVDLPVASVSQCSIMFENYGRLTRIGQGQFCAGGESGKDSCTGDSGAPLMRQLPTNPPRWYIEGVVSFGVGCGLKDHYGIYTKVSKYLNWIHSTMIP